MMEALINAGIFLIIVGFLIVFLGAFYEFLKSARNRVDEEGKEEERKSEYGGVIFIGPIPIIFGSSKKVSKWMIVVALIITLVLVALYLAPFFY